MRLSEDELASLMAYADGEVDADELPHVEALLARSEEARQIVAQGRALSDWVRASSDARAAAGGADRIAARVHDAIEQLEGAKVVALENERARRALPRPRIKEFGALVAILGAAAAAAYFLVPARPAAPVAAAPAKSDTASPVAPSSPSAVASAEPSRSAAAVAAEGDPSDLSQVDVQSVESPSHPFSIFYIPGATGLHPHAASVVVWVGEETASP